MTKNKGLCTGPKTTSLVTEKNFEQTITKKQQHMRLTKKQQKQKKHFQRFGIQSYTSHDERCVKHPK